MLQNMMVCLIESVVYKFPHDNYIFVYTSLTVSFSVFVGVWKLQPATTEGAIEEDIGLVLTVSDLSLSLLVCSLCSHRTKPSTMLFLPIWTNHSISKGQSRL